MNSRMSISNASTKMIIKWYVSFLIDPAEFPWILQ